MCTEANAMQLSKWEFSQIKEECCLIDTSNLQISCFLALHYSNLLTSELTW